MLPLVRLSQSGFLLVHVRARAYRGHGCLHICQIDMQFNEHVVTISVTPDTDELVEAAYPESIDGDIIDVELANYDPWAGIIGTSLGWSWAMRNNRGYDDAVQLEFVRLGHGIEEGGGATTVQLIAVGGAIQVMHVRECPRIA